MPKTIPTIPTITPVTHVRVSVSLNPEYGCNKENIEGGYASAWGNTNPFLPRQQQAPVQHLGLQKVMFWSQTRMPAEHKAIKRTKGIGDFGYQQTLPPVVNSKRKTPRSPLVYKRQWEDRFRIQDNWGDRKRSRELENKRTEAKQGGGEDGVEKRARVNAEDWMSV